MKKIVPRNWCEYQAQIDMLNGLSHFYYCGGDERPSPLTDLQWDQYYHGVVEYEKTIKPPFTIDVWSPTQEPDCRYCFDRVADDF